MNKVFVYGSLQPGGPNEHELAALDGEWEAAVLKGRLLELGWGADLGYPGLAIDDDGEDIQGYVLSSHELQNHWARLDEFEGAEYERTIASVTLASGAAVDTYVYVLRDKNRRA